MNQDTGRKLQSDGSPIMLGDVLKGSQSTEVIVLWDEENQEYGVQTWGKPDFWFPLDSFLWSWGSSVIRTRSVLTRVKVESTFERLEREARECQ